MKKTIYIFAFVIFVFSANNFARTEADRETRNARLG
ncbi:hypothetical protein BH20ACI4_BH20ACI4_14630 [soil metagenome]